MTRTIDCKINFQLGSDLLHEVAVGKIITNTKTNIRMSNSQRTLLAFILSLKDEKLLQGK